MSDGSPREQALLPGCSSRSHQSVVLPRISSCFPANHLVKRYAVELFRRCGCCTLTPPASTTLQTPGQADHSHRQPSGRLAWLRAGWRFDNQPTAAGTPQSWQGGSSGACGHNFRTSGPATGAPAPWPRLPEPGSLRAWAYPGRVLSIVDRYCPPGGSNYRRSWLTGFSPADRVNDAGPLGWVPAGDARHGNHTFSVASMVRRQLELACSLRPRHRLKISSRPALFPHTVCTRLAGTGGRYFGLARRSGERMADHPFRPSRRDTRDEGLGRLGMIVVTRGCRPGL